MKLKLFLLQSFLLLFFWFSFANHDYVCYSLVNSNPDYCDCTWETNWREDGTKHCVWTKIWTTAVIIWNTRVWCPSWTETYSSILGLDNTRRVYWWFLYWVDIKKATSCELIMYDKTSPSAAVTKEAVVEPKVTVTSEPIIWDLPLWCEWDACTSTGVVIWFNNTSVTKQEVVAYSASVTCDDTTLPWDSWCRKTPDPVWVNVWYDFTFTVYDKALNSAKCNTNWVCTNTINNNTWINIVMSQDSINQNVPSCEVQKWWSVWERSSRDDCQLIQRTSRSCYNYGKWMSTCTDVVNNYCVQTRTVSPVYETVSSIFCPLPNNPGPKPATTKETYVEPTTCKYQDGWNTSEWSACQITDTNSDDWLLNCTQTRTVTPRYKTVTSRLCPIADKPWIKPDSTRTTQIAVIWILWSYNLSNWSLSTNSSVTKNVSKIWSTPDSQNSFNQKATFLWASQNELSNSINTVRKNAEELCKSKWKDHNKTLITESDLVIWWTNCIENTEAKEVRIVIDNDITVWSKITNIVTKWWWFNLIINQNQSSDGYLNVFIDGWILTINDASSLKSIDWSWEISTSSVVAKWFVLRWNYIINWLIWWWKWNSSSSISNWYTSFSHRLYVHWTMIFLNTLEKPNAARVDLISWLLNTIFSSQSYLNLIRLKDVFVWKCDWVKKLASDGNVCNDLTLDKWAYNAIIIIDKNLKNILMK